MDGPLSGLGLASSHIINMLSPAFISVSLEGGKCSEFCTFGMEPWTNIEHRPSILCNFFALWLFRPAPRRTANSFLRRFGTTGATLSDRITYHVSK